METFSSLLAICAGNSSVPGEFPAQRPVTLNFDVFFDLHLNKQLSKQSWGWWFETLSRPLWWHCNVAVRNYLLIWHNNQRLNFDFYHVTDCHCIDSFIHKWLLDYLAAVSCTLLIKNENKESMDLLQHHFDGLVPERHNSIVNALDLYFLH